MKIGYSLHESLPQDDILKGIFDLHYKIFGNSSDFLSKMKSKPQLTIVVAQHDDLVIGYKIGYELNQNNYYSWLGGVDSNYRGYGVASKLMHLQHMYLKEKGYSAVQTKTMNKWRGMLLLNIKNGFDVIETYTNKEGLHKIILEKRL
ncbi:GNAT family N-acetyltransferase [Fictibacillus sp. UD]|uniref:GNAT family N-acetyltransferase n=1 Tax=Fictibacillus sp. UD TaxID=3038777 RepID=UPI003744B31D